jgi:hypothetical protein
VYDWVTDGTFKIVELPDIDFNMRKGSDEPSEAGDSDG